MGRQILFHMLLDDQRAFIDFVTSRSLVVVTTKDSKFETPESIDFTLSNSGPLCLWNREILPKLRRKWIAEPGYYRIDLSTEPVLELIPSLPTTWGGKPALTQGRLYGIFERKTPVFHTWFESLRRWIRQNFSSDPTRDRGYVGPAAYRLYREGGYLLPQFVPPETPEWFANLRHHGHE